MINDDHCYVFSGPAGISPMDSDIYGGFPNFGALENPSP